MRRIDAGDVLAALGALLLFVALFLRWYEDESAWEAFEALDLLLAAGAIAVIAAAGEPMGLRSALRPAALVPLGLLLLAIVIVQVVEPPPSVRDDADRETGAWLALVGASLAALGAALRVAKINVTVSVGGRETRRRVPAVDRRPAASAPGSGGPAAPAAPGESDPTDPQPTQPFSAFEDR